MKIRKSKALGFILAFVTIFFVATGAYALGSSNFFTQAQNFINDKCSEKNISKENSILCYLFYKAQEQDSAISSLSSSQSSQSGQLNTLQIQTNTNTADISTLKGQKRILDIQDVRGSSFTTSSAIPVATPDRVTVNCSIACDLIVNYYVDTRNNSNVGAAPSGFNNIYDIYVDGTDEAIFTQASNPVPNAAIPLALNGLVPASAGTHLIQIYAYTNGGQLQSYESGLEVTATTP